MAKQQGNEPILETDTKREKYSINILITTKMEIRKRFKSKIQK